MFHVENSNEIDVIIYVSHIEKANEMDRGKAIRGYLVSLI